MKKTLEQALEQARNDAADDAEYQYRKKVNQENLEQQTNSTTPAKRTKVVNSKEETDYLPVKFKINNRYLRLTQKKLPGFETKQNQKNRGSSI